MNKLPIAPEYLLYLIVLLIGITIFTLHVLKSKKIYEKFRESNNKLFFICFTLNGVDIPKDASRMD